jgi:hypothetical protein
MEKVWGDGSDMGRTGRVTLPCARDDGGCDGGRVGRLEQWAASMRACVGWREASGEVGEAGPLEAAETARMCVGMVGAAVGPEGARRGIDTERGSWCFDMVGGRWDITSVDTPASILEVRLDCFLINLQIAIRTEVLLRVNLYEYTLLVHRRVLVRELLYFHATLLRRAGGRECGEAATLHCCKTGGKPSEHGVSGG